MPPSGSWSRMACRPSECQFLEVSYEDIVADFEGQSRRIVDFLGLPWEEGSCAPRKRRPGHDRQRSPGAPADLCLVRRQVAKLLEELARCAPDWKIAATRGDDRLTLATISDLQPLPVGRRHCQAAPPH